MTDGVKFQKAIQMLDKEYLEALSDERIRKPMAKALYTVWKHFDEQEKTRKGKDERRKNEET